MVEGDRVCIVLDDRRARCLSYSQGMDKDKRRWMASYLLKVATCTYFHVVGCRKSA